MALRNVRVHLSVSLTFLDHAAFRVTDGEIYLAPTPQSEFLIDGKSMFQIKNTRLTQGVYPMTCRYREVARVDITRMSMTELITAPIRHDVPDRVLFRSGQSEAA